MASSWDRIKVDDSVMRLYISVPPGDGFFPGLVVIQHQAGVDRFVEEMTERLAEAGYVAVAPDLYHRDGPDCKDDGATRKTRLRDARVIADVNATVEFLKRHISVDSENLGIVGFCMGGRVTYMMAAVNPGFKTAVSYYGGNLFKALGKGPSPFERTRDIHCPLLGHFGEEDQNPSLEDMRRLDAELTRHGKVHEFYTYPGAGHAFMNKYSPDTYRLDADQASWPRTIEFLRKHLAGVKPRAAAASR